MCNLEKDCCHHQEYYPINNEDGHCNDHCHMGKGKRACVEEVLEAILKAQRKVEKEQETKHSSCEHSFEELLDEPKKFKKNTIPFILYCGCKPYKGEGVTTYPVGMKDKKFVCISSFIFRINNIKGNCAELELLTFKTRRDKCEKMFSPCDQINHQRVNDLVKTGICITVDLSCFCGISTLPAVRL